MIKITVFDMRSSETALANALAENGHDALIWDEGQDAVGELNTCHTGKKYLKYTKLDANAIAAPDMAKAVQFAGIYLVALPAKAVREIASQINNRLAPKKTSVHVAKGTENRTFKRMSEMIEDSISPEYNAGIGVLSGLSHAEEVVVKQPTTVAASSRDKSVSKLTQDLFINDYLRVYTNDGLIGVELGNALKNIIAVASSIVTGIGYGDSVKAALMTRDLAEISRLGEELGADPMTLLGLGGIGDLIVTCTPTHSRNFTLEHKLGQGKSTGQVLPGMSIVVEGICTTKSVYHLAREKNVDIPITNALYRVLFENTSVKERIKDLMGRDREPE